MCLLFTGSSIAIRAAFLNTPGLIEDVFQSNADGFGFMYATKKGLKVVKKLPNTTAEVRRMFEALPNDDRMVAGHARMRTHGAINLDQCHPYQINESSWLMHNGVLHTGNKADPSKSDTWHFINDFLKEASDNALHDPALHKVLGEYIESNRFAIMSGDGRLSIVNRDQGIEHEGVWFSNTYAWSPNLFIPSYRSFRGYSSYYGKGVYWEDDVHGGWPFASQGKVRALTHYKKDEVAAQDAQGEEGGSDYYAELYELIRDTMADWDVHKLSDILETHGADAVDVIMSDFLINAYEGFNPENFSEMMCKTVDAWVKYDDAFIKRQLGSNTHLLAEALMYYCDASTGDEEEVPSAVAQADDFTIDADDDDDVRDFVEQQGMVPDTVLAKGILV